jgi:hypothetical protein
VLFVAVAIIIIIRARILSQPGPAGNVDLFQTHRIH